MTSPSVRVQAKGQVTIPKQIRESLAIKPGDQVVFVETEAGVLLKPVTMVMTDALKDEFFAKVEAIQARFGELSAEEVEQLVDEAIQWARA